VGTKRSEDGKRGVKHTRIPKGDRKGIQKAEKKKRMGKGPTEQPVVRKASVTHSTTGKGEGKKKWRGR